VTAVVNTEYPLGLTPDGPQKLEHSVEKKNPFPLSGITPDSLVAKDINSHYTELLIPAPINDFSSVIYLFMCYLNSPKANYKSNTSKKMSKTNTPRKTKQGKAYHLNNTYSIDAIISTVLR
jgi:hypothetical protein